MPLLMNEPRSCAWCDTAYTVPGPGRPSAYCSDACRQAAKNEQAKERMQRLRDRKAQEVPWYKRKPRGRPRKW